MLNFKSEEHRKLYKWNPVYNFIMNIKDRAIKHEIDLDDLSVPFKDIVNKVGTEEQKKIASILQFNRNGYLVLVRYGNYSDILSGEQDITMDGMWDMYDGFYHECRSVVIDIEKEDIVLCPFAKFRNLNEGEENSLENIIDRIKNCESFEVSNKLDGSMQSVTWYDGKVVMAGSQAVDMNDSWRLRDGYNMLMSNENYVNFVKEYGTFWTIIFEYISLKDAHVVKYSKEQEGLYLIGMRDKFDGTIVPYKQILEMARKWGIKTTILFDKNLEEVLSDTHKYKANEMEGFVLNIDGYLLKVKCDDYVQIHKTISGLSSSNGVIKAIADETFDDFVSKIPSAYKDRVNRVAVDVFEYLRLMEIYVEKVYKDCLKNSTDRKSFVVYLIENYSNYFKGYVINKYLGKENNYIKSGNQKCPHYKKINEIQKMLMWILGQTNCMTFDERLKSCPMCDAPAGLVYVPFNDMDVYFRPECTECGCGWKYNYPTKEEAIEAWNKRGPYKGLSEFGD